MDHQRNIPVQVGSNEPYGFAKDCEKFTKDKEPILILETTCSRNIAQVYIYIRE
jgi:hypothetical protein